MEEKDKKQAEEIQDKQFKLTTISLKNRTTVFFLTFLVVIMGVTTYLTLPKDSYPEIEQPIVYVGTPHPGNSPIDMENLITRPLEKEINTIAEVDNIKSTSVQDHSTIIVEFTAETDIEDALQKVKDAVDRAKPELPQDLDQDPNVFEMNFSEFPIMNINLSGDYPLEELNEYAEYLEDEIEKVSEVSKVDIRGIDEKEVQIKVDPYAMEARQVNFGDIEDAVMRENVTMSGGNLLEDGMRRAIRVVGEFDDPKQLEEIVVKNAANIRFGASLDFGDMISVGADVVAPFNTDNPGGIQNAVYSFGGDFRPVKWLTLSAGYYGGGGGGYWNDSVMGGGGGGSSYINTSLVTSIGKNLTDKDYTPNTEKDGKFDVTYVGSVVSSEIVVSGSNTPSLSLYSNTYSFYLNHLPNEPKTF